jgi:PAS domain S-box-containing protein
MISTIIIGGLIVAAVLTGAWWWLRGRTPKHGAEPGTLAHTLEIEKSKSDIILNSIDDGVVVIDNQRVIQMFNPAAGKLTGWPPEEAVHIDYNAVIKLVDDKNQTYSADQNPFELAFKTAMAARSNTAILVSRDNKHIGVDISVSPLYDKENRLGGVVGILSDVGEARTEERQRAEFISTASHEMRTPVAAIEGYLALAMNDKVAKVDDKAREYLQKAHASTQHLGKLFQDLLTSAKAEDGRLMSNPVVIEMGAFLEQLSEDFRFIAQQKGLLLEYIMGASTGVTDATDSNSKIIKPLYYVYADPDRVQEVISNLFDNAVKYTDTGKITIGLTGDKDVVQFYVKDSGAGISGEDIPHLFQKFYRVNSTLTRTIGGTGLGLFISRKIIELYNGRIWVESHIGRGSTFYINLPRLDNMKAASMQAAQGQNPANITAPTQPKQG